MDIYTQKSNWKIILAVVAMVLLLTTLYYSNHFANQIKENEEQYAQWFLMAFNENQKDDVNEEVHMLSAEITFGSRIPVITENTEGKLEGFRWCDEDNINCTKDLDSLFLHQKKEEFIATGKKPIEGTGYARYLYYYNSELYTEITYFPIIQILLVGLFIALGYYLFSTARRAEQNRVWAGMAKETAHQLGTPISAIIGWIEHLKLSNENNEEQLEVIDELRNDVTRLELIADRFSKIGSAPELTKIDIETELRDCVKYMERRSSRRVSFVLNNKTSVPQYVNINSHLFDWVIENLYRNALDALNGEGSITTNIYTENEQTCIDIIDTGSGIPSGKLKTVFQPGFSTKVRGWGLGLSLAKRIIEDYHNGKIFVKQSKINEGTTFTIKLPKV